MQSLQQQQSQSQPQQQLPQPSSQQQQMLLKTRVFLWQLKEVCDNMMRTATDLINHNSQIDSNGNGTGTNGGNGTGGQINSAGQTNQTTSNGNLTTNESKMAKFERIYEDFLGACNQMELHLRTIQECNAQNVAFQRYTPSRAQFENISAIQSIIRNGPEAKRESIDHSSTNK